ncbi:MAG TPA: sensor histidine kinase [Desulfobacteraceae bacterium]|nr:sensor histidine kinase [Desulfobacteraceae bacterium]
MIDAMKFISGITGKLFGWYFIFVLIFYGTVFILYDNIQQMMKISENIINRNYKLSSASKNMIENLLNMEENEKKYMVLKKEEYLNYFFSAQKEFEKSLAEISEMESKAMEVSPNWKAIKKNYAQYFSQAQDIKNIRSAEKLWIPEYAINKWIEQISLARADNEREIEIANMELNLRGQLAVRSGLIGLGISTLVGLLGGMMLAHSMVRPLRELLNGIRSISEERQSEPIRIRSKDEFGELANAFNEMAFRLKEEQKMRSDFISMLSHEIRTPLTSIRESVNLIAEGIMGAINDRQRKFLEIASLEIGRVCELLNRMMQVSCLESGAFNIKPCPLTPDVFVSGCLDQIKAAAESKGIIIDADISHNLPELMGDAKYLQQVLGNLLGNAIKFSPSGSRISINIEPDGNQLIFTVSDDGPGIPEEEQAFIFNKYYRAKGVRDHQDGMGLGLSITKHIVEAHGGTIWVKSDEGKGSTFGFSLPKAGE